MTVVETFAGLVLILILGVVAVPRVVGDPEIESEASCKAALGLVRSAIANHYARTMRTEVNARYPTPAELTTPGRVLKQGVPANPYNGSAEVQTHPWDGDRPPVSGTHGWNYDPVTGRFWTNATNRNANRW